MMGFEGTGGPYYEGDPKATMILTTCQLMLLLLLLIIILSPLSATTLFIP